MATFLFIFPSASYFFEKGKYQTHQVYSSWRQDYEIFQVIQQDIEKIDDNGKYH